MVSIRGALSPARKWCKYHIISWSLNKLTWFLGYIYRQLCSCFLWALSIYRMRSTSEQQTNQLRWRFSGAKIYGRRRFSFVTRQVRSTADFNPGKISKFVVISPDGVRLLRLFGETIRTSVVTKLYESEAKMRSARARLGVVVFPESCDRKYQHFISSLKVSRRRTGVGVNYKLSN